MKWNVYINGKLADVVEEESISRVKKVLGIDDATAHGIIITKFRKEPSALVLSNEEKFALLSERIGRSIDEMQGCLELLKADFDHKKQ